MRKIPAIVTLLLVFALVPLIPARQGPGRPADRLAEEAAVHSHRLIFPQAANGQLEGVSVRSTILVINNSLHTAEGILRFFQQDGVPMEVGAAAGNGSVFDFSLLPGQIYRLETDGQGELQLGWAEVESDIPLAGNLSYGTHQADGSLISAVGVGDSPVADAFMVAVDRRPGKDTAFAVCNPGGEVAQLQYELRRMDGTVFATASVELPPGRQKAEYVFETFADHNLEDFTGVLLITSETPLSVLSLRTRGLRCTSIPSAPVSLLGSLANRFVFPRVVDGSMGGCIPSIGVTLYVTSFIFLNPSEEEATAEVFFRDLEGEEVGFSVGGETVSRVTVHVPPGGAADLATDAQIFPPVYGWAEVRASRPIFATSTFAHSSGWLYVSEYGVPGSILSGRLSIYVRVSSDRNTALAVSNPSDEEVRLRLRLYREDCVVPLQDSNGDAVAGFLEETLTIPPRGGVARYVKELLSGLEGWYGEGRLDILAYAAELGEDFEVPVAGINLLDGRGLFTSLPTAPFVRNARPLTWWDAQADELLGQMTLSEKVGQMTQADRGFVNPAADVGNYLLGSLLSGGGSRPQAGNQVRHWADMYEGYQQLALGTRLAIPLIYGIDAVHGHSNVEGTVIFPHNIGLGATRNPALVERVARATAIEVRATGMNWTFSPCVAVPRDERWGRTYEGFSEDPELVRVLSEAAVRGYQGIDLGHPLSIVACAKHYLGDGGTAWGTGLPIDQGDTQVDEATLRSVHLPGYLGALEAGVATIMPSFSSWNGEKMSGHHYLLTTVLKEELGFQGFLISDWAAIDQLPGDYRSDVKTSINAGMDMVMVPDKYRVFFDALKDLVEQGEIPMSRIDDAVRRILRVKLASGLLADSVMTDRSLFAKVGSPEHRRIGREAVRQSQVLLKNQEGLLPLSKSLGRIHLAGKNADDIGNQCGGWTIDWQGKSGNITTGTTIRQAIEQTVSSSTQVTYSRNGSGAAGADVVVVVIGETPYAEMVGDRADLGLDAEDLQAIDNAKAAGVPVVVILVSGRPMILGDVIDRADAFLAAWLPGTEGLGVADVIFGDYAPTGRLPFTWPRSMQQIPINLGDADYDPLFEYGFGLTY
jgi:beta-glucosidase